ncbi:hypothetical protein HYY69_06470 [Candidatus Woesearchaeota archaeon]|nr:hypothetical protein [Candidatus Woesearchaeota archaeon]
MPLEIIVTKDTISIGEEEFRTPTGIEYKTIDLRGTGEMDGYPDDEGYQLTYQKQHVAVQTAQQKGIIPQDLQLGDAFDLKENHGLSGEYVIRLTDDSNGLKFFKNGTELGIVYYKDCDFKNVYTKLLTLKQKKYGDAVHQEMTRLCNAVNARVSDDRIKIIDSATDTRRHISRNNPGNSPGRVIDIYVTSDVSLTLKY